MKFRTDFVTNSSSSSFIFQRKFSIEEIRHLRAKLATKVRTDPYSTYKELNDDFDYLLEGIKTPDKFSSEVLAEVVSWYRDKMVSPLIGDKDLGGGENYTLSDEKLRILAGIWYFDYFVIRLNEPDKEYAHPTYDQLEESVWFYLSYAHLDYGNELFDRWITDNAEKFLDALVGVAEMPLPELFQMITGGKYMYYDSFETCWLVSEVFREDENCLFGCNHMG